MSRRILLSAVLAAPLAFPAQALEGSLETPKEPATLGAATDTGEANEDTGILTGEETVSKDATPDLSSAERFKARASTRMDHWLEAMTQYDGTALTRPQISRLNEVWAIAQRDFAAMMAAGEADFPAARTAYTASMERLNRTWSDLTQTAQAQ